MKEKKTNKANLEKSRFSFMLIGAVVALGGLMFVFEHGVHRKLDDYSFTKSEIPVELQITELKTKKQKSIPEPNNKEVKSIIVVKNDAVIKDTTIIDIPVLETEITNSLPKINKTKPTDFALLYAEHDAEFPGGVDSIYRFIEENLKYPENLISQKIQGRVYVRFIINKNGKISKAGVIRSIHPDLDKEALRLIKLLPKWKPAIHNGKIVSLWKTLPVNFIIEFLN